VNKNNLLDRTEAYQEWLKDGKAYTVIIQDKVSLRTDQQNRAFYGGCRDVAKVTGQDLDTVKAEVLSRAVQLGGYPFDVITQKVKIDGKEYTAEVTVAKPTSERNTKELNWALDALKLKAADANVVLRLPEAYL